MTKFFQPLVRVLFHLGYFGPFVMGVMDSSFLFLPVGNDLVIVLLVARHHAHWWIYVVAGVCGSTLGSFFLDLVARKVGETGIQKIAGNRRFDYLKRKIGERGAGALMLACLSPPPFPFTMVVATTSALGYPRRKLLLTIAGSRAVRFVILALLALKYGRGIMRVVNSRAFKWTMIGFAFLCIVGSVLSIAKWVRGSRKGKASAQSAA